MKNRLHDVIALLTFSLLPSACNLQECDNNIHRKQQPMRLNSHPVSSRHSRHDTRRPCALISLTVNVVRMRILVLS